MPSAPPVAFSQHGMSCPRQQAFLPKKGFPKYFSRLITTQEFFPHTPIDVHMRTFYNFLGDALHRGPSDLLDRGTSLIIAILGTGFLALMAYAVLAAWR